jgi:hypothetical protein
MMKMVTILIKILILIIDDVDVILQRQMEK